ncbi:MAG TPA: LysR family transcriptional regulator [Woeseiaceae bacterium]|nr:LysR family transcriptional regulator [Woeseiaceae bacterium]
MDDWNDLRFVLAVARAGALTAAAKALGIDHSTAFRRLNALEARLGARLFERLPAASMRRLRAASVWLRRPNAWRKRHSRSAAI